MASPSQDTVQSQSPAATALLLAKQLKQMQKAKDLPAISCGLVDDNNIFKWEVMLMIDEEDEYYGGAQFRAYLTFPPNYPFSPPTMVFQSPAPFHPNVYPENSSNPGLLCISILHPPHEDPYGHESVGERWSSVQTPETILLSVISLLSSPSDDSPANIEAGKLVRQEREAPSGSKEAKEFKRRTRRSARDSLGE